MTDSTKQTFDEIVTAVFDGEASEFELQRLLKHMNNADENELRAIRQGVLSAGKTSAAITASAPVFGFGENLSFANGVSAAIANEQIDGTAGVSEGSGDQYSTQNSSAQAQVQQRSASPFGFFGKAAIAASVAFVFVMGAQVFYSNNEAPSAAIATADIEQTPVQAVVPEGYIAPRFQANTAAATGTSSLGYQGKIELDEEQLQARLDELMQEVRIRQLQQLQLQSEGATSP